MKKIIFSVLAIAALAACTKSEVQYEAPGEIGFAPAVKNITKAAMAKGVLAIDQELGVWAFWDKDGAPEEPSTNGDVTTAIEYTKYSDNYLVNALFVNKSGSNWGAPNDNSYPWPLNGALVFAGYTTPGDEVLTSTAVSYNLTEDKMTFTNFTQSTDLSKTFDLCWFGRTEESYNNRISGDAIPVVLSHALSWLKFNVKGEGSSIGWKITQITLNDIANTGTGVCIGSGANHATWTCNSYTTDMNLFTGELTLTDTPVDIEKSGDTVKNDFVVIPQTINAGGQSASRTQHTLTITYQFPVGDSNVSTNWKTDTKTVNLDIDASQTNNKWVSGTKYTYTLTFKANEILVAPSYGDWATSDQNVTVE